MAGQQDGAVRGETPEAQQGPPTADVVDGKPQGVFFMTRYWSYTHTLEKAAWYFSTGGQVYQNLEHGFSAKDLADHKGPHGTYRIIGGQMEVTWSDGKVAKSDFKQDKHGFAWDMGIFIPTKPIADSPSVVGTYEGGESLTHGGNKVATGHKLELHADGTYRWEGVALVEGGDLGASKDGVSTGKWKASGYSLVMSQDDGKTLRRIAFPVDDETSKLHPTHLFVGGMLFKKQ